MTGNGKKFGTAGFFAAALAAAALALLPVPAFAQQMVKDAVVVDGMGPMELKGYGLVIGLNGSGDSPGGETERMLRNFINSLAGRPIREEMKIGNVAMVLVTGEITPFQKRGTRMDVRVSALADCKSLAGGTLLMTFMRSPYPRVSEQGKIVYAVAQGSVIVEGDNRNGVPTTGIVKGGAVVKAELPSEFVRFDRDGNLYVKLLLKRPDWNRAFVVENEINRVMLEAPNADTKRPPSWPAQAVDAGSILIAVPTEKDYQDLNLGPYPKWNERPVAFLDKVLRIAIPTGAIQPGARVVINDTLKTVSWNGPVRVRQGRVRIGGIEVVVTQQSAMLGDVLNEQVLRQALTEQNLVNIIRAMDEAEMIEAEVVSSK